MGKPSARILIIRDATKTLGSRHVAGVCNIPFVIFFLIQFSFFCYVKNKLCDITSGYTAVSADILFS